MVVIEEGFGYRVIRVVPRTVGTEGWQEQLLYCCFLLSSIVWKRIGVYCGLNFVVVV